MSLEVRYEAGFLARPALRRGSELDDKIASLQYRHVCEYAVGHGVAVEVSAAIGGNVTMVTTTWLPRSEVRRVATSDALGNGLAVEQRMAVLADLADGAAVQRALGDLPTAYGRWIDEQRKVATDPADRDTLDELVKSAGDAQRRIAAGIELLATSDEARKAFALANRAMADQAFRRLGLADPPNGRDPGVLRAHRRSFSRRRRSARWGPRARRAWGSAASAACAARGSA